MDRLDVMQLFVRVADSGSFSKAAKTAGIGQPTVSKQIAALESRLGAQLLRRTSRGLSLTEAGRDYHAAVINLIGELDAAEARIGHGQVAPSGLIRVAMSAGFGRMYVVPRLPAFFQRFPDVAIDLDISERHVNLVESGIDVAIRMGHLTDSSLLSRRIGSMQAATVATPAYLAKHGEPLVPADLSRHNAVIFMFQGAPRPWRFKEPDGPIAFMPQGLFRANDAEHLRTAVLTDLGIGHNARWLFAGDLAAGAVIRLLPDYTPELYPVHAVWPSGRRLPGKVKAFIDFLADICDAEPHLKNR